MLVVVALGTGSVPRGPRCVPVTVTGRERAVMNPSVMVTRTSVTDKVIYHNTHLSREIGIFKNDTCINDYFGMFSIFLQKVIFCKYLLELARQ